MVGKTSSVAGTAAGVLIIVAVVGATVYGGVRFVAAVREERSPAVLAWVATGVLLYLVSALAVAGTARLFRVGEDAAVALGGVVGLVVVVAGLGGSFYWVHVREPAFVTALGGACRGDGVAAAPAVAGAHRVVVLDDRGHKVDWTTADAGWRTDEVAEADLVACLDRRSEHIETCTYRPVTGGPTSSIDRFAETVAVRVVQAHTAKAVGQYTLRDEPRACRQTEKEGQDDLHGHVSLAAFSRSLEPYLGR